jgi:hypothetical protein
MTKQPPDIIHEKMLTEAKRAMGFMARPLVQATLPHSNPGDVPTFVRTSGNLQLIIQPLIGQKDGKPFNYGLPYGVIPRLVLAWLSTEAVKTRSREIPLGDSLSAFMRELDMIPTGGRWGSITRLREQIKRLFSCTFSIVYEDGRHFDTAGFKIAREAHLFWDTINPEQQQLFGSMVVLSSEFYEELIKHPVPIDTEILKALKKSPLAIDLYTWLTYRMSYLKSNTLISWELLQQQFGSDYSDTRMFKFKLIKHLEGILSLYPVKVVATEKGLMLKPSPTSIGKK